MISSHGMPTASLMFRPSSESICCFCFMSSSSFSLFRQRFVFFHNHYRLIELMPAD